MKRTPQEIVELVVFGLIALLLGTGILWLLGAVFGILGTVLGWLASLLWGLLSFLVPVALVAGAVVLIVRWAQGRPLPGGANPAAASPQTVDAAPPAPPAAPVPAPPPPQPSAEEVPEPTPPATEDEAQAPEPTPPAAEDEAQAPDASEPSDAGEEDRRADGAPPAPGGVAARAPRRVRGGGRRCLARGPDGARDGALESPTERGRAAGRARRPVATAERAVRVAGG